MKNLMQVLRKEYVGNDNSGSVFKNSHIQKKYKLRYTSFFYRVPQSDTIAPLFIEQSHMYICNHIS